MTNSNKEVRNYLYFIVITKTEKHNVLLPAPTINPPSQATPIQAFLNLPSKIRTRPEKILLYIWYLKADTLTDSADFLVLIKLPQVLIITMINKQ